ncbi:YhcB family protein [Salinicola avicenniae]|uniref:YhcB family protein n=1 Tax=Salinicola avicenniae TaxID=2916836 RepID=UPI00207472FD|nr:MULTISPECIES: DUF1043 family protein [unclassified Salinicola]
MESLGVGPWIAIVVAVGAVGILIGYWLGARLGGHNTEPMRELHREHKAYKDDVREHFEQVSATMTRMVEDYRDMYQHVAKGAEKLADMHHETVIEPPPKPEAITQEPADHADTPPARGKPGTDKAEPNAAKTGAGTADAERDRHGDAGKAGERDDTASATSKRETDTGSASQRATTSGQGATTSRQGASKSSVAGTQATTGKGDALDDQKQAAGAQTPSDTARPQDAAIRAAAEDAATSRKP